MRLRLPCLLLASLTACSTQTVTPDADTIPLDGTVDARSVPPDASHPDAGLPADAGGGCVTVELCDDGLDNDCDDVVDEECPCIPGETASCFRGPASARGVGACSPGTMECMDGLEFGLWGPCVGDVLPADELCDAEGEDESCDGAANEGCDCDPAAPPAACGSAVGACRPGTQECVAGRLGACVGASGLVAEACNGADDDCDGATDEGIVRVCGTDVGECSRGSEACVGGAFEGCAGGRGPVAELCNGLDDDCDGSTDEALTRACGSSVGACMPGTQRCDAGSWTSCGGETVPALEVCDGVDDDCDGRVDEGVTRACGSSTGVCRPGTQSCASGSFGACTGGVAPGSEVCDGALDEDCDGTVDEMCGCTTGTTRPCGTDVGECVAGSQTCDASGSWGGCAGATGPSPEVCNMRDDDCDGATDEMGVCPTAPPVVTCPGDVSADVLDTIALAGSGSDPDGGPVSYAWTVTSRPPGSISTPSSPSSASTNFYLDASGAYVVQLCVTDDEGERACCSVNVTSNPPGAIHVEISWSTAYGDVDAHLLNVTRSHPNGWWTADDCYFANRAPDWGPVGVDGNPTLDIDDTDGYGPENITVDRNPAPGTYTVGAHYFCDRSLGMGGAPGSGATDGTVRIFCDGALVATYTGVTLGETDDWVSVAEIDYPSCAVRRRTTRTEGSQLYPASFTAARHCEISCSSDADCPAAERCARVGGGGPPRNACILR